MAKGKNGYLILKKGKKIIDSGWKNRKTGMGMDCIKNKGTGSPKIEGHTIAK